MDMVNYNYSIRFDYGKCSIREAANRFFPVIKRMAEYDEDLAHPLICFSQKTIEMNPLEYDLPSGGQFLAEAILKMRGREYKKDSRLPEITLDYCQDLGFVFSLRYTPRKEYFSYSVKIGSSQGCVFATSTSRAVSKGPEYVRGFLQLIVELTGASYAKVVPEGIDFIDQSLKHVYAIGYLTYFSKDYPLPVPDDLPGISYEHVPGGKYLILAENAFTSDPEKFAAGKQNLIDLMHEIARRVPGYRKAE